MRQPLIGELVQTRKGWVVTALTECPVGHPLVPGQFQVGNMPCAGPFAGGHTVWMCPCGANVYAPGITSECELVHGASRVRNL